MDRQEQIEEFVIDWVEAAQRGDELSVEQLCAGHPELQAEVSERIRKLQSADWMLDSETNGPRSETAPHAETAIAGPEFTRELGDYVLEAQLGHGGMGEVYRARHVPLNRQVALKILPPHLVATPDAIRRFQREVEAASRLEHPHIVSAYAAGTTDNQHYLAMQLIEGEDLDRRVKASGPLSVEAAMRCLRQTASALAYAHQQGVIHRDIKPSNLLLDAGGNVFVLDMGLARLHDVGAATDHTQLTQTGVVMGTAAYMSPEQADDTRLADARSDLYSLGCTFYFLLTGEPPYTGESFVKTLLAHRRETIPRITTALPGATTGLDSVLQKLLAKAPEDRFQTAEELLAAIDEPSILQTSPARRTSRLLPVSRRTAVCAATVAVVLCSLGVAWMAGLLFKIESERGTLVIDLQSDEFSTEVRGETITIRNLKTDETIDIDLGVSKVQALDPGEYEVLVTANSGLRVRTERFSIRQGEREAVEIWWEPVGDSERPAWSGWPDDEPAPAIAPFSPQEAQQFQEAWAKHLGVPVDFENSIGLRFRVIPPGEFLMGSSDQDIAALLKQAKDDASLSSYYHLRTPKEGPQHTVILSRPFGMGTHEVTLGQFREFVEATGYVTDGEKNVQTAEVDQGVWDGDLRSGVELTDNHPVVNVSWNDATAFCEWLSKLEGVAYRLPTEAEWEFACRAGSLKRYCFGDDESALQWFAWSGDRWLESAPQAVGGKSTNAWGIHDMHGNVFEWCRDFYGFYGNTTVVDPISAAKLSPRMSRVWKGGANNTPYPLLRCANRISTKPDYWQEALGFRVVIDQDLADLPASRSRDQFRIPGDLLDVLDGQFQIEKGELVVSSGYGVIRLFDHVPDAFDLEFQVQRTGRPEAIKLAVVGEEQGTCVVLGGWGGTVNGVRDSRGLQAGRSHTAEYTIPDDRSTTLRFEVRPRAIRALRDGVRIVDWRGKTSALDLHAFAKGEPAGSEPGIHLLFYSTCRIADLRLQAVEPDKPLSGGGPDLAAPSVHSPEGWNDYLDLLDVAEMHREREVMSVRDVVDLVLRMRGKVEFRDAWAPNRDRPVTTVRRLGDISRPVDLLVLSFEGTADRPGIRSWFGTEHIEIISDWVRRIPHINRPRLLIHANSTRADGRALQALAGLDMSYSRFHRSGIDRSRFAEFTVGLRGHFYPADLLNDANAAEFFAGYRGEALTVTLHPSAITAKGLRALHMNRTLRRLLFGYRAHAMTDEEVDVLCGLKHLESINFWEHDVTRQQYEKLALALPHCQLLGPSVKELARPLQDLSRVDSLITKTRELGGEATQINYEFQPTHLALEKTGDTDRPLYKLGFNFQTNSSFGDDELRVITELMRDVQQVSGIEMVLNLEDTSVTSAGVEAMGDLLMHYLHIPNTRIGDAAVPFLLKIKEQRGINLSSEFTDVGFSEFARNSRVVSMGIDIDSVSATSLKTLNAACIEHLLLRGTRRLTDEDFAALSRLSLLKFVDLSGVQLTPAQIVSFRRALPYCDVRGPAVAALERQVAQQVLDATMQIGGTVTRGDGMALESADLASNKSWSLDFTDAEHIGDTEFRTIGELLRVLPANHGWQFDLSLRNSQVSVAGLAHLSGTSLRELDLRGVALPEDDSWEQLLRLRSPTTLCVTPELVSRNSTRKLIEYLYCTEWKLGPGEIEPEVLSWLNPKIVRRLELQETRLTDEHITHLKGLQQLESLRFIGTDVSDAQLRELRQSLQNCEVVRDTVGNGN